RTDADLQAKREGPGAHDELRDRVRSEGGGRGPPWPYRPVEGHGRRVPGAAGHRAPRAQEDRPTRDGSSEWCVLCVPARRRRSKERLACGTNPKGGGRCRDPGERVRGGRGGPPPSVVCGLPRDDCGMHPPDRGRAAESLTSRRVGTIESAFGRLPVGVKYPRP